MFTPWGQSDYTEQLEPGVLRVGTPSHGGLMITRTYAEKHLSPEARERGMSCGIYLAYEEDCNWCIAAYELKHLWPQLFRNCNIDPWDHLLRSLSRWNLDYLRARAINPMPEEAAQYDAMKRTDELRRIKPPDLIVSASTHPSEAGKVVLTTADGKEHVVDDDKYDCTRVPNLLSFCR